MSMDHPWKKALSEAMRKKMAASFIALDPGRDIGSVEFQLDKGAVDPVREIKMIQARDWGSVKYDALDLDAIDPAAEKIIGELVRKRMEQFRFEALAGTTTLNTEPAEPATWDRISRLFDACGFERMPGAWPPFRFERVEIEPEPIDRMKMLMNSYPMYRPIYPSGIVSLDPGADYPTLSYKWTIPNTRRAARAVLLYTMKPGDRRRRRRVMRILRHEIRNSG